MLSRLIHHLLTLTDNEFRSLLYYYTKDKWTELLLDNIEENDFGYYIDFQEQLDDTLYTQLSQSWNYDMFSRYHISNNLINKLERCFNVRNNND